MMISMMEMVVLMPHLLQRRLYSYQFGRHKSDWRAEGYGGGGG